MRQGIRSCRTERPASRGTFSRPRRWEDLVCGFALLGAPANVVLQLALPPVGYGVARSRVRSGRLEVHPFKRTRTTVAYLAVALLGSDIDRVHYAAAIDAVHARVRSVRDDPVSYEARDPELQLWVALCLFRGSEDAWRLLNGRARDDERNVLPDSILREGARLATTLQVPVQRWPSTREEFDAAWADGISRVKLDDEVRSYLLRVVRLEAFPTAVATPLRPLALLAAAGFLPVELRTSLGLEWSERRGRVFATLMRSLGLCAAIMPGPVRRFPFNALLFDVRRRNRRHLPLL